MGRLMAWHAARVLARVTEGLGRDAGPEPHLLEMAQHVNAPAGGEDEPVLSSEALRVPPWMAGASEAEEEEVVVETESPEDPVGTGKVDGEDGRMRYTRGFLLGLRDVPSGHVSQKEFAQQMLPHELWDDCE